MSRSYRSIDDVYRMLDNIPMFGNKGKSSANFSLDAIRSFCESLGDPQNSFRSIHVAGTNGKGTTCRMLASVYQSAGYKTGLFTSPHLTDYRERVVVNGQWIGEDELLEFFRAHSDLIDQVPLTYFELSTAIAFWYFARCEVDIAIIETGLGGRLDATNIIIPIVSVVTSIGLDHTDILGNTVSAIAREKAGIIKPGVPVVAGDLPNDAKTVLKQVANENQSVLIFPFEEVGSELTNKSKEAKFAGQSLAAKINRRLVQSVLRCVSDELPVSSDSIDEGLLLWSSRFPTSVSFQSLHPTYPWYFDGAHNVDALRLLKRQMQQMSPVNNWIVVFSMMKDKLTAESAEILSEAGEVYFYEMDSERAAGLDLAEHYIPHVNKLDADSYLPHDWVQKYKSELVIFGGSFYFYRTVKRWMGNIG